MTCAGCMTLWLLEPTVCYIPHRTHPKWSWGYITMGVGWPVIPINNNATTYCVMPVCTALYSYFACTISFFSSHNFMKRFKYCPCLTDEETEAQESQHIWSQLANKHYQQNEKCNQDSKHCCPVQSILISSVWVILRYKTAQAVNDENFNKVAVKKYQKKKYQNTV